MGLALKEHLSAGGRLHPGQDGRDGGLARAVFSDQTGDLPAVDLDTHVIEGHGGAEVFAQIPRFNNQLFFIHGGSPHSFCHTR